MGVKLFREIVEGFFQDFILLLVESRAVRNSIRIVVEIFYKFMSGGVAAHGNKKLHEVFKNQFPVAGKIPVRVNDKTLA